MTTLVFLAAILFAFLAMHPFSTYPFSLFLLAKIRKRSVEKNDQLRPRSVSVLISARNEAAVISKKIASVKTALDRLSGVRSEILIYADGCSDTTASIATELLGAASVVDGGRDAIGKSRAMNALVDLAQGDILVLTDANAMLAEDALEKLLDPFASADVGCVLGKSNLLLPAKKNGIAKIVSNYWQFEEMLRRLETETGSTIGGDGALYGIRKRLWPFPSESTIDDFFVPMWTLISGYRVVFENEAVVSEPATTQLKDEARRKYRIAVRGMSAHLQLSPSLKQLDLLHRYKYYSHKYLKWMVGLTATTSSALFLLTAFISGLLGPVSLLALVFTAAAAIVLGRAGVPGFSQGTNILTSLLQVTRGVIFALRGGQISNWKPPVSDRKVSP
ncbi:glycosyltransferase [Roseibium sp. MMSF_3412]|uniref:glycosyltransferase n=1 Tax=Roseibium sp. MMSF_3412 TaxID=3046712 RepID=UPI00273DE975|nr:glycosyltransferase [Roseibium sp. MMSF_3412]